MKRFSALSDDELAALAGRARRELPDAPAWLVESAVSMWRAPVVRPSLIQRIAAALSFDSWAGQPTLALRSALPAARHLLFTAQGRDVDLRVSATDPANRPPTRFAIAGQVLGPGLGGTVSLALAGPPPGAAAIEASLDDFGEFRVADLAAGTYVMTLRIGDDEIVLPPIDVAADPGV